MNNGRDCEHGQLARSCDRCADAAEIAELRKELAAEREHMAELEALARHEADCAEAYKAESAMLRATMAEATYALSKARIWGGMDWHYNPLHPMHYKPALDKMREVLDGPNVGAKLETTAAPK